MLTRTILLVTAVLATCQAGYSQSTEEHEDNEINRKRLEWFWNQRTFPQGSVPHQVRLRSIREMERLLPRGAARTRPGPRPQTGLSTSVWTSIGPQPIGPNNYNSFNDAGRVWALAVDPGNPAIVYAGTDGGGVWKTTDSGATWTALTDQQPSLGIASLAIDPSNSSTIYAGTGGSSAYAAGILKSTDAGATWTQITGPFLSYYSGIEGPVVSAIAVNPSNGQIILAGLAYTGIYRSTDGGSTWTSVLSATTLYEQSEVVFDPSNPAIAYTGVSGKGVYKSTDTGQTWSLFNGSGSTALPVASMGAIDIAVAPSASGTIYAALKNSSSGLLLGFYKSRDGGLTWNQIGAPSDDQIPYWNWSLRVNPANPNVVYAGSLVIHQSLDGGSTWNDSFPTFVHVDHHAQAFSSDGSYLYIGSDGGVWSTSTPSTASTSWNNLNASFSTVLFYPGLSIQPTDVNISYGGTQDNGTLQYGGSAAWAEVQCGDGAWTAIDFTNPQTVYTSCSSSNTWVWKYSNGSWAPAISGFDLNDRAAFILPLVMDPSNAQRLYVPTYRLYQTNNGASSWTAISPDLTASTNDILSTVAVAPSDSNTVYTGSYYGKVFVTRNATAGTSPSWTDVTAGLPQRSVTQIVVSRTNPQTAYVTLSGFSVYDNAGHIWVTNNAGGAWSNATGNLPDVPVNDLVIDPDVAGTLYAATDIGVFRSLDSGASWLPLGTGLPYVVVNSLKLHESTRTLRAATYGRSAWDILVTTANQVNVTIGASVTGAPFILDNGTTYTAPITFAWTIGAIHTVTWPSTSSSVPGSRYIFQGWTDNSSANPRTFTVPSANSTYTANLTAQYLLTLAVSPAGGGTLTPNPTSPDGYYNSGTSVTLTASASSGYTFWYFSGLGSSPVYSSPQTVTLSSPMTVTGYFYCSFQVSYWVPNQTGSGPASGFLQWQTGQGCAWTLSSNSSWMTVGPPASGAGNGTAPFSIAQNNGAARSGTVTLKNSTYSFPITVAQSDSTVFRPSNVSLNPNSANGASQTFTFQYYDPSGFGNITYADINVGTSSTDTSCTIYVEGSKLYLVADDGSDLLPLTLPTSSAVQNSTCQVNGAASSISGSGNTLSITLAMTFRSAFPGARYITTWAGDTASGLYSYPMLVGAWTPPGACDVASVGYAGVSDVQRIINEALGSAPGANDLNHDGVVNVVDLQLVLNAALGLGCSGP